MSFHTRCLLLFGVLGGVGGLSPVGAQSTRFELSGHELKLPGPVVFETGSDRIKTESASVLAHVQAYLDEKRYITLLRIEVHTDATGQTEANQKLTEKRAWAVGRWLVDHGVACRRLIPVGFGEHKPIADNRTSEGRAQNRRVSFVNAELRGRAIGQMPVDGGGKVAGDLCKPD